MKEKCLLSVKFVANVLSEGHNSINTLCQIMKVRDFLSVNFVAKISSKRVKWLNILFQFMKERNPINAKFAGPSLGILQDGWHNYIFLSRSDPYKYILKVELKLMISGWVDDTRCSKLMGGMPPVPPALTRGLSKDITFLVQVLKQLSAKEF